LIVKKVQVVYKENGVKITAFPAIHAIDGSVSCRLDWNGLKTGTDHVCTFVNIQKRGLSPIFILWAKGAKRAGEQLGSDYSRKGLEYHFPSLRTVGTVVREDLATR
jgi:hypothetical protein